MLSNQIIENLKQRNLQLNRYKFPTVDEEHNVLTVLFWNLLGGINGYGCYRPDLPKNKKNENGKSRYYVQVGEGKSAIWGLETYHYREDVLCITEGMFDANVLHNEDIPSIAVFTNNPKPLRPWLFTIPRTIIAIRDNDGSSKLHHYSDYSITPFSKDLGEASKQEVDDITGKIKELCLRNTL